ncbi:MAG: hypothetical protein AAF388_19850 [Bacteroidota bacterium]
MDQFKIDLFEKEYKRSFLEYRSLTQEESKAIKEQIYDKFRISITALFGRWLEKSLQFYSVNNAKDEFKLEMFLSDISIEFNERVFINWNRFDEIDVFSIADLDKYFYDIWYPSADDIEIFDESLDWIVSIRHDGRIFYMKT